MKKRLRIATALGALGIAFTTAAASAQSPGVALVSNVAKPQMIVVQVGELNGDRNAAIAWQAPTIWQHGSGVGRLQLVPEFSAGYADDARGSIFRNGHGLWHFGATAFLQWYVTPRSYVEIGTGPNYFTQTRLGNQEISTRFQFGDSIGYEQSFPGTPWGFGVRFTHYSNAGIKRPNFGVNFLQLVSRYSLR